MKKRFKFLALIMVACFSFILAGCDLFKQNTASYLNQIVITAKYADGSKIEISRMQYLTAYNNYGATLVSSNGYTEEQAKEATINSLVNREIILKEAKQDEKIVGKVNDAKQDLYYQTYEALISNARDYESAIRKDWNMPQADSMAEETKTGTVYTPYEQKAQVVYDDVKNEYRIKKIEQTAKNHDKELNSLEEVKQAFLAETKENTADTFAAEEYRRYVASLKQTQQIFKTNYNEEKLVEKEVERIYENLEDNKYISEYQIEKEFNGGYSTITVEQVLNYYKAKMGLSKFEYDNDAEVYSSDMLESFKDVNYIIDDNYFNVAHILIKFNETEQAKYDELESLSNNGQGGLISPSGKEKETNNLYNNLRSILRDSETGEILTEDDLYANELLSLVQKTLNACSTNEEKDEAFRELMYKYNEDDGIMNADYSYVVGTENSKMVESFTNASRELHEAGEYGAVSGLVRSEYGIHIIYYMGQCENVFEFDSENNITLNNEDVLKLAQTKLNNLSNKTLFDLIYENLSEKTYAQFEEINLETLKSQNEIIVTVNKKI